MRNKILMVSLIMSYNVVKSQSHGGFEQYYYAGRGMSAIVPKIYYETQHHWYGEVRYNYEQLQTVSFNAGKTFLHKKLLSYSVTPFAGLVLGRLTGETIGLNMKVDYKSWFFSFESQYTFSPKRKATNFFFNWSECGYELNGCIYTGVALQLTRPFEVKSNWQPGVMMALMYKSWTFPVYVFNPAGNNPNFVVGINWEWKYGEERK